MGSNVEKRSQEKVLHANLDAILWVPQTENIVDGL
jgi:hypothetical protein